MAARAAVTRRAAASSAPRPARDSGAAGIRSMSCPRSAAIRSPATGSASSSSSHACHRRMTSMSFWSARRAFCCRTTSSSRARDSFSSCQYSFLTAASPTARSSHLALRSCLFFRRSSWSDSSDIGSTDPLGSRWPEASARRTWVPSVRSWSASCPQVLCCTASHAPFTLRLLLAFRASTSCFKRPAKARQPMGSPATVFGLAWHAATS
mmetsp:Transcript_63618/g.165246  ORF Transcript_63618/g.165246 Transcript_63618/m.165246 type:complete len:209 (-) Transcript_63618:1511-2137(-)